MSRERRAGRYGRLFGANPQADVEDELSFHIEMRVREYMRRGMAEGEARRAALDRLGDLQRVRSACVSEGEQELRARRRTEWFSELHQDVRYGVRTLLRARSFSAIAVLTLGLGIGATTAIFSLVHGVLLAPLPYAAPERLVQVWETSPQGDTRNVVSPGNVLDWQAGVRSVNLGAYRSPMGVALTGEGEATRVMTVEVQPALLRVLGVAPALGRAFTDEDAVVGDVVLLSDALWRTRYGGDGGVIGRRIVLDDVAFSVIGVMPPAFSFPHARVQLWRPLREVSLDAEERRSHNYLVIGRLAPGVGLEAAQADLDVVVAGITAEHPQFMTGWGANVVPLHRDLTAEVRPLFAVLLAGVAVVLLIACGNLANLLLARAVSREREIALRGALGAGRGRITRQLLTESALLAVCGGAAALLIAPLLLDVLIAAAPADIPLLERASVDARMLIFTAVVALGCAMLFGLAPAARLVSTDLQAVLRSGGGGADVRQTRLRGALLVAEVALSVMLLVGAGLFARSFAALQATDPGFAAEDVALLSVDLPRSRFPTLAQQDAFYARLLERVAAVPGVVTAAGTNEPPGGGYVMTFSFSIAGRAAANPSGREDPEQLRTVTPGYFAALRQDVVAGRAFDERDRAGGAPVAIINESLARKHWPGESPIGHRVAFRAGESAWLEIVGVVRDVRLASRDEPPVPALYIPHAQRTWEWLSWLSVVARTAPGIDAASIAPGLREALSAVDANLPPLAIGTIEQAFRENVARRRFALMLVTGFSTLALILSLVGLYGLLAWSVARQQKEIGVRLALGAGTRSVVRGVLIRSLLLALIGAAAGTLLAAAASRSIASLLFGVSPLDLPTYVATALLVLLLAVAAALVPAWRAAHVSPLQALRAD